MAQKPFQTGTVLNLIAGESTKEAVIVTFPRKKRFHTQYLGIYSFGQPNQSLFYAVHVTTRSRVSIYPIGISSIDEPEFPARFFGSQEAISTRIPGPTSSSRSRPNTRPRKCLNFATPLEVYAHLRHPSPVALRT